MRILFEQKIPKGQVYMPRLEPTAPIHLAHRNHTHHPSHRCTIFIKRWLNDGLPAHIIQSESPRESSEDVIYTSTVHTKSMVWPDVFPRSRRATSQTVEGPNPWRQTRETIYPEEEYIFIEKIWWSVISENRKIASTRTRTEILQLTQLIALLMMLQQFFQYLPHFYQYIYIYI